MIVLGPKFPGGNPPLSIIYLTLLLSSFLTTGELIHGPSYTCKHFWALLFPRPQLAVSVVSMSIYESHPASYSGYILD